MQIIPLPYSEDEFTMVVAHEFFDALPVNIIEENAVISSRVNPILTFHV